MDEALLWVENDDVDTAVGDERPPPSAYPFGGRTNTTSGAHDGSGAISNHVSSHLPQSSPSVRGRGMPSPLPEVG